MFRRCSTANLKAFFSPYFFIEKEVHFCTPGSGRQLTEKHSCFVPLGPILIVRETPSSPLVLRESETTIRR